MKEYLEQYTGDTSAIEYLDTKDVFDALNKQGSNPYPRIVAVPDIITRDGGQRLRIRVNRSKYGIALIEEKKLMLPTAIDFRAQYALSALAIRVAYVFSSKDGSKWVACHQRQGRVNATWPHAWDVGGAGYINAGAREHRDPDDETIVSPWQAAVDEISKELNIHSSNLPHRDSYYFFGVANDKPTDHLILIGFCDSEHAPDEDRKTTARVEKYGTCQLNPEDVAAFVAKQYHWVPAALLTLVCTLQYFGYAWEDIEKAFSPLEGKISLVPR
jgi:hypothetical protein